MQLKLRSSNRRRRTQSHHHHSKDADKKQLEDVDLQTLSSSHDFEEEDEHDSNVPHQEDDRDSLVGRGLMRSHGQRSLLGLEAINARAAAVETQKPQRLFKRTVATSPTVPRRIAIPSTDKTDNNKSDTTTKQPLPDTWYYSSNHVLVNRERVLKGLPKLSRSIDLDTLATQHAQDMADNKTLYHSVSSVDELKRKLHSQRTGENIQRGSSIRQMHSNMMTSGQKSKQNILSKKFGEFGMGTAKGHDGKLYMVQLFRGNNHQTQPMRRSIQHTMRGQSTLTA